MATDDFLPLLQGLASSDNTVRQQAELAFNNVRDSNPDIVVEALLNQINSSHDDKIRTFSCILLRQLLKPLSQSASKLTPPVIQKLKGTLLEILCREPRPSIKKALCLAIAMLANKEQKTWPELFEFIFAIISTPNADEHLLLSVFHLISRLGEYAEDSLKLHAHNLFLSFSSGLVHTNLHIRAEAMKSASSFLVLLKEKNDIAAFQPLVEPMVNTIASALQEKEVLIANNSLTSLIEVASCCPDFLRNSMSSLGRFMITFTANSSMEISSRKLCMELMISLSEAAPGMVRKDTELVQSMLHVALSLSTDLECEEAWKARDYKSSEFFGSEAVNDEGDENDDEHKTGGFGQEAIARLSDCLGEAAVLNTCFTIIPTMLADETNPNNRYAAIDAIGLLSGTCSKGVMAQIKGILPSLAPFASDSSQRVRYALVDCLAQFATNFEGKLQKFHHKTVFPMLISILKDESNVMRVRGHAASAVVNFCNAEQVASNIIEPYLNDLMLSLLHLLNNGSTEVQRVSLMSVACVAAVAKDQFGTYYDSFIPGVKNILRNALGKEHRQLRATAIETIGLIAESVGIEKFSGDAKEVMEVFLSIQHSGQLTDDDPQAIPLLQACTRICKCLKGEFLPYMSFVMPLLIHMASGDAGYSVEDVDAAADTGHATQEGNLVSLVVNIKGAGNKKFTLNTVSIENKTTACRIIFEYATELGELFMPYVEQVSNIVVPLIKFAYNEAVRGAAALCTPPLLYAVANASRKANQSQEMTLRLLEYFIMALLEQLRIERDSETRACHAEAVCDLMKVLLESGGENELTGLYNPPQCVLPNKYIDPVIREVLNACKASLKRRHEIVESSDVNGDDWDEEAELALEEDLELEVELMEQLINTHGYILKMHKENFMTVFDNLSAPYFKSILSEPNVHPALLCNAICVFDDAIEFCGSAAFKYVPFALKFMLGNANHEDSGLRQACCYGLSQCAEHAPEQFQQVSLEAFKILLTTINNPNAQEEDYACGTDNAIAALGKVLTYHDGVLSTFMNVFEMWNKYLNYLPLKVDEIETVICTRKLCDLVESGHQGVLGMNNENIPLLRNVFETVLVGGEERGEDAIELADTALKSRISNLLTRLK